MRKLRDFYDTWMDERPHTYTEARNMHGLPLKTVLRWVHAWRELDQDIIIKSFTCCVSSNAVEDAKIACFRPGKSLNWVKRVSKMQWNIDMEITRMILFTQTNHTWKKIRRRMKIFFVSFHFQE